MVKYYESNTIFQFNWDQVARGFWQRYPNPNSTHVLTEDTVSRKVEDGMLHTTRLLTKTNRVPKWGERFISKSVVKIVEETIVDPKTKTLTTYTRNLGYTKVMVVVEKVVYKVCEENPNWTVAKRSAWIDSQVFGFGRAIQAFGLDRFKKNCTLMYNGFNYVLAHMFPHTAQYMNPTLSQMGFAHLVRTTYIIQASKGKNLYLHVSFFLFKVDEGAGARTSLAEDFQHSLQGRAEKVKDAAKKATDLAKKKAGTIYAAYQSEQS
ncbi:PRELI domain-containing protein 1, mitochondrial isoform X1 [Bombus affinis]|uniref:PRELI domain-containing protein 1, mitochondrial isoform X1 n=1 Tax=Bombus affinis TaxID=309941 RepID=UPI0021B80949|nr:PRELI domain-containing protein 1, mitochondrial isoform X1 [Bombus affinis]XP_050595263.1 PRELI domain-containing protein 1, mitochondrial isoform X1 [Bombus affinis]